MCDNYAKCLDRETHVSSYLHNYERQVVALSHTLSLVAILGTIHTILLINCTRAHDTFTN